MNWTSPDAGKALCIASLTAYQTTGVNCVYRLTVNGVVLDTNTLAQSIPSSSRLAQPLLVGVADVTAGTNTFALSTISGTSDVSDTYRFIAIVAAA